MACRLQENPRRVLYFRIQSSRTQNNITSVCVYIYYIANEQIAAMWHGLVAWQLRKETHTHTVGLPTTHTLQSPTVFYPFASIGHNTHTCAHTPPQGPQCSQPVCPSAHAQRWAGSTYHHSAEWKLHKGVLTHTHTHRAQGDHSVYWLNVWWDSSLSKTLLETSR